MESAAAEQARADIRLTYDNYRTAQQVHQKPRGRIPATNLTERSHQLLVAGVVGVVERFALDSLIKRGGNEKKARDWDGQIKQWATLGVDLPAECPTLDAIRGLYEARTAILHNAGQLTTGQLVEPRHTRVHGFLAAAGIDVPHHRVHVDEQTATACVDTCLRFLDEVEPLRPT